MLTRLFTVRTFYILFSVGLLVGCQPAATLEPDPLPASLRVTAQTDSVIATPQPVDFSIATQNGQGPTGSLVQWNLVNAIAGGRSDFNAYTYDEQRHLIGTYARTMYGYENWVVGRYQSGYLAEAYTLGQSSDGLVNVQPDGVYKYQYNDQKKLSQVFLYKQPFGKGPFKLFQRLQYEYNGSGQLQLTRSTFNRAFDNGYYPTILRYWENGDCIRTEIYEPNANPRVTIDRIYYNQQVDPTYGLTLVALDQRSQHYIIGSGPSASGPSSECCQYQYTYDSKGRVNTFQMRSLVDPNPSTGWIVFGEYTYAP